MSTRAERGAPAPARGPLPPIRLLQATAFVSTLDRFAMPPLLVAIAVDLDVPLSAVVHAAGLYFLVYGLSQPFWGVVSDRLGRVRTMRLTLLLAGVCTIASAAVGSTAALGAARGLAGGFFGAAYPATLIYLGDTVPAAVRQRDIARLMVGVALGTALASVGAGALADVASWRATFVLTGLASLALVWALRRLPEPVQEQHAGPARHAVARVARSRVALVVLAFAFVEGAVLLGGLTLLPPALEDAGATAALAGAVTGIYGLSVLVSSWTVGSLSQRWHPRWLILGGAAAGVAACLLVVASRAPVAGAAAVVLIGVAWTSMHSSLQTWATEVLPSARAVMVSLFAGSLFVGSAACAVLVAGPAAAGRYAAIYAVLAALMVPLGLAAWWARGHWRRPEARRP